MNPQDKDHFTWLARILPNLRTLRTTNSPVERYDRVSSPVEIEHTAI